MPKESRLSRADFKLMRGFKRLQGRFFSLSYGTIPGRRPPGGAVVVSGKAVGSAVKRNAVKRKARVALVEALEGLRAGGAYVFYAKKGSEMATFVDVKNDVSELLARARASR
jgi:ribonuclease P protein component